MPLLSAGADGATIYPVAIRDSADEGLVTASVFHHLSKHLQQVIESDHFRVKQMMPKAGGFRSFATARRVIAGFEARWQVTFAEKPPSTENVAEAARRSTSA